MKNAINFVNSNNTHSNVEEFCNQCIAEYLRMYGDTPQNRATIITTLLWWESEEDGPFHNMVMELPEGEEYYAYAYPSVLEKVKEGKPITVEVLCRYWMEDEECSFNLDFEIALPLL